jgi:hypothetical protein
LRVEGQVRHLRQIGHIRQIKNVGQIRKEGQVRQVGHIRQKTSVLSTLQKYLSLPSTSLLLTLTESQKTYISCFKLLCLV